MSTDGGHLDKRHHPGQQCLELPDRPRTSATSPTACVSSTAAIGLGHRHPPSPSIRPPQPPRWRPDRHRRRGPGPGCRYNGATNDTQRAASRPVKPTTVSVYDGTAARQRGRCWRRQLGFTPGTGLAVGTQHHAKATMPLATRAQLACSWLHHRHHRPERRCGHQWHQHRHRYCGRPIPATPACRSTAPWAR